MVNRITYSEALLTKEDVRRWHAERDEIVKQISVFNEKLEQVNKRLAYVAFLLGEDPPKLPDVQKSLVLELTAPDESKVTWRQAVQSVLLEAGKGLAPYEIAEVLKSSDFKDRFAKNPNTLYNTINQLIVKHEAVRKGSLIYATDVLHRLAKNGEDIPTSLPVKERVEYSAKPDSTAGRILNVLKAHPEGLRGSEVIDKLRNTEGVTNSAIVHTNFVYTVLGKLVKRNAVAKEGMSYKLSSK